MLPFVNTQAMNLHLQEISRHVASGAHAVLVLDGAGWHGAAALAVPENITLLPLPPYSPELNPVENVWEYLRPSLARLGRARPRRRWRSLRATRCRWRGALSGR